MPDRAYFISDVHLGLPNGKRSAREHQDVLIRFLRHVGETGNELYIVGDLFDFWFEYRSSVPRIGARVLFELYGLVQKGISVAILPGNHDIWLGSYLSEEAGLSIEMNPVVKNVQGRRLYITHGDDWKRSLSFTVSRAILNSPLCIGLFRLVHPDLGVALGRLTSKLADASKAASTRPREDQKIYIPVAERLIEEGNEVVVCGHFHQAMCVQIGGGQLIILGNWFRSDTYAEMENGQIKLMHWNGDEGAAVDIPTGEG